MKLPKKAMADNCFIGIDTSNYTTSLAFVNQDGEVVANLKIPLSVKEGERGLRQSDAVFQHTKNLPDIFNLAEELFEKYRPVAVGVSTTPRSQDGSYMPCFLAGKASAYAMAKSLNIPLFELSHQNGHIMAAAYSGKVPDALLEKDFLAFHVSGGTTEALLVKPDSCDFKCEIVGGTKDINAGQAIDRVGVAMGLDFPCGPSLEKLALEYKGRVGKPNICVKDAYCNLSGLENKALELYRKTEDMGAVASYVLNFIGATLKRMTDDLKAIYPRHPRVYSGGVLSCSVLRDILGGENSFFAEPKFSADKAAGVALLCRRKYLSR